MVLVCGRYEGVDERWIERHVDLEISVGDFVLTGGEAAAVCVVDAVVRLLPGALGNAASASDESFSHGMLGIPSSRRDLRGAGGPGRPAVRGSRADLRLA